MPTTRPRKLRLGGVEVSVTLDRMLAERLKAMPFCRWLRRNPAPHPFHHEEPVLGSIDLADIDWYQTIDLGNGVVTPGFVDHRSQTCLYGLPDSLTGQRCLDVATADGFWAFEMEKRGAAEVVAIDLYSWADGDFPANWRDDFMAVHPNEIKGLGFAYAKRALGSRVRRKVLSIYELSPEHIGTFDFVFVSDILLHLRDPLGALERVWAVTRGEAIIADAYDAELEATGQESATRFCLGVDHWAGCYWWRPTTSCLQWMLRVARFREVEKVSQFELDSKLGKVPKVVFRAKGGRATSL